MNEHEVTSLLEALLDQVGQCRGGGGSLIDLVVEEIDAQRRLTDCRVQTFADVGLLTTNDGVVLSLADGSEFQITVVQSR